MRLPQTDEMDWPQGDEPDERAELLGHPIALYHDDQPDSWLAIVVDLPGIMAQASTKKKVLSQLRDELGYATAS